MFRTSSEWLGVKKYLCFVLRIFGRDQDSISLFVPVSSYVVHAKNKMMNGNDECMWEC